MPDLALCWCGALVAPLCRSFPPDSAARFARLARAGGNAGAVAVPWAATPQRARAASRAAVIVPSGSSSVAWVFVLAALLRASVLLVQVSRWYAVHQCGPPLPARRSGRRLRYRWSAPETVIARSACCGVLLFSKYFYLRPAHPASTNLLSDREVRSLGAKRAAADLFGCSCVSSAALHAESRRRRHDRAASR